MAILFKKILSNMRKELSFLSFILCISIAGFSVAWAIEPFTEPGSVQAEEKDINEIFIYPQTRELAEAAEKGDVRAIKRLIEGGENVDAQGLNGATPLMWMVIKGSLSGVKALLDVGADPNLKDDEGDTAVTLAAGLPNPAFLQVLLVKIGNSNDKGPGLQTPLMIAAAAGRLENIRSLLDAKAQVNAQDIAGNTALIYATRANHTEVVALLLKSEANKLLSNDSGMTAFDFVRTDEILGQENRKLQQILQITAYDVFSDSTTLKIALAAEKGDVKRINELVAKDVRVDATGFDGITPLLWALSKKSYEGVTSLLNAEANPNKKSHSGLSGVLVAASLDDHRFLQAILSHGGQTDTQGPGGLTPLMTAVRVGSIDNVRLLIQNKADIHAQDTVGFTAIHHAVISNRPKIIQFLLNNGAMPDPPDDEGLTPVDYARELHLAEIMKLLTKQ